jgi:secretion/DNA translocation related CpaE-like protein
VFAAALAEVLAEVSPTLLIDADPAGPGIDRVLGTELIDGVRWDGLAQAAGRLSARSLHDALPRRGRLSVLTWSAVRADGIPAEAMRSAVSTGRRAYPLVVVDLGRNVSPELEDVLFRCDQVLLVSTLTVPAVAAAAHLTGRLPGGTGLVLRRSGAGVAAEEVAHVLGLPVRAQMRDQRGLDEAIALGLGPLRSRRGPLARAARSVAAGVRG